MRAGQKSRVLPVHQVDRRNSTLHMMNRRRKIEYYLFFSFSTALSCLLLSFNYFLLISMSVEFLILELLLAPVTLWTFFMFYSKIFYFKSLQKPISIFQLCLLFPPTFENLPTTKQLQRVKILEDYWSLSVLEQVISKEWMDGQVNGWAGRSMDTACPIIGTLFLFNS